MQDFRNLDVWSKAHKITLEIYRLTESFPRSEVFGLIESDFAVRPHRLLRIWRKDVGERNRSSGGSFRSHWARRVKWNTNLLLGT